MSAAPAAGLGLERGLEQGLEQACARLARANPPAAAWRATLERLLLDLDAEAAEELMQLLREGRAAWLPLCEVGPGARALLIGNALSGAAVALARGLALTVVDDCPRRLALAAARDAALVAGATRFVLARGPRLPFVDASFGLVVRESEAPPLGRPCAVPRSELARVCADELVTVEENRFAYKRSSGRRADFRVARPLEFLGRALRPEPGAHTLRTHLAQRRALGFASADALALYPHAHDFTHVVGLGARGPRLWIGPKERANRLKLLGARIGAFPWLTPSFAVRGRRSSTGGGPSPRRIERLLAEIARRLDQPTPRLEHLVASRGNASVMLTAGAEPGAGRWCLHAALGPHAERQARRHAACLRWAALRLSELPAPRPLLELEFEGVFTAVEQRLDGVTAAQLPGPGPERARVQAEVARALGRCVVEPARPTTDADVERLLGLELQRATAPTANVRVAMALGELAQLAGGLIAGEPLPRVLYHADLRAKHVACGTDGALLGLLDFGSAQRAGLPYFDLLNLVLHDRKQDRGGALGGAWRACLEGRLTPAERAPLDDYCAALGLGDRARAGIELAFPILVGAMAEGNWDFSRPRWLARSFQLESGPPDSARELAARLS